MYVEKSVHWTPDSCPLNEMVSALHQHVLQGLRFGVCFHCRSWQGFLFRILFAWRIKWRESKFFYTDQLNRPQPGRDAVTWESGFKSTTPRQDGNTSYWHHSPPCWALFAAPWGPALLCLMKEQGGMRNSHLLNRHQGNVPATSPWPGQNHFWITLEGEARKEGILFVSLTSPSCTRNFNLVYMSCRLS